MNTGIPKQFQLAGHTIKVKIIPHARWPHKKDTIGVFDPSTYEIHINSRTRGTNRQQTFTHELVHALLIIGGHGDISDNEDFVDRMGHLLHQAMTTFA